MSAIINRSAHLALAGMAVALSTACASADLQSAKLAGPGRFEVTPGYTRAGVSGPGLAENYESVANQYSIRLATGITDGVDVRALFEHVRPIGIDDESASVIALGPKFAIVPDVLAIDIPVGFAIADGSDISESISTFPTLLATVTFSPQFELTGAAKVILPLSDFDERDALVAFNLGAGLSSDLSRWALRPEIGIAKEPGEQGYGMHMSVGLTMYLDRKSDTSARTNRAR